MNRYPPQKMGDLLDPSKVIETTPNVPAGGVPPDLLYKGTQSRDPGQAALFQQQQGELNSKNNPELFRALRRQGYFVTQPFTANNTTSIIPRPFESRTYLFIQNLAAVGDLYIGFGAEPNASFGLTLIPGAAYEPFTVPVNEIYIRASAASVSGYLIYSREAD